MKALFLALILIAQGERQTDTPHLDGQPADVQIDERWHIRNEGGSDDAGLCVDSSAIIAGAHQNIYDLRKGKQSKLWLDGKARPGGSYPEKLAAQLIRVYGPNPKFAQKVITNRTARDDYALMEKLTRAGYAVCTTMNTGDLYYGQPIHHWVTLQQFRSGQAWSAWVDSNKPGVTFWAQNFDQRVIDGDSGWVGWWTELAGGPVKTTILYGVLPMSAFLLLLVAIRRRWALCPVAAIALLCVALPARAQCPPGVICEPQQQNYVTGDGVLVMYPKHHTADTADWAANYRPFTDADGGRYLTARVTSAKYGAGSIYFQPDTWKQPKPQPTRPSTGDVQNFGIQIEDLGDKATDIESLDPSWNPESLGIDAADVQTHFDKALRSTLPVQYGIVAASTLAFAGAIAYRLRRRRLA